MTVINKAAPALARLLEDSALARAVFSACRLPIAVLDATRRVTAVNPAFEAYFGWREAETVGRALATLVLRGDDGLVQRLIADSGSAWTVDAWRKDGEGKYVEVALGAIRNVHGQITHWVVSFCDKSDLRLDALLEPARRAE